MFTPASWIGIGGMLFALSIGFMTARLCLPENLNQDSETFGPLSAIAVQVIVLMGRDYPLAKRSVTAHMLYLLICYFAIIIVAYYSGFLTSLVTTGVRPASISK